MSVPNSESTASPGVENRYIIIPQNKYSYVVFIDSTQHRFGVLDMYGRTVFVHGASSAIKYALEHSEKEGPVLLTAGNYDFRDVLTMKHLSGVGREFTSLEGQTLLDGVVKDISFSIDQHWTNVKGGVYRCHFKRLTIETCSEVDIVECVIDELVLIKSSKLKILTNKIGIMRMNGCIASIVDENTIEEMVEIPENVYHNNIIGKHAVGEADTKFIHAPITPVHTNKQTYLKTGHVQITGESGGTNFPSVYCTEAKIFVSNVTFPKQEGEPKFFISDAPYFDPDANPQTNGYCIQWPNGEINLPVSNLNQINAVSSVSGAFLSYIVVDTKTEFFTS